MSAEQPKEAESHEQILQNLKSFIADTKVLIDRVMKMRIECKDMQMTLLRLFDPECLKILEISDEVSRKNIVDDYHQLPIPEHNSVKTKLFDIQKSTQMEID